MTEYLYARDGEFFVPTEVGGSPWHPGVLHGGTATGLLGRTVESLVPAGFVVTRLTMDLVRPVPKAPLRVQAQVARDGSRLKVVEVDVSHEGKTVCRAAAVLIKTRDIVLPDYAPRPQPAPPGPDGLVAFSIQEMLDSKGLKIPRGLHTRVEVRAKELWAERGRNMSWLRLPVQIVQGEELTPFTRTCLLCDLGNGVAQLNIGNSIGMINADVTLTLFRQPAGEWICFESEAQVQPTGTGIVHSTLYDADGSFGYVTQSVMANGEFAG